MKKTEKVIDVWDAGIHITVTKHFQDKEAPYWVYSNWYDDGWHKKRIARGKSLTDALWYIWKVTEKVTQNNQ